MYSRQFITLKADTGGYGVGGRSPSGRCILEMRGNVCKISLSIQDIKQEIYKVYIIEREKTRGTAPRGLALGSISADTKGRGDLKKEFGDTIAGRILFEDIGVVILVASKATGTATPLIGFVNNEATLKWKNFLDIGLDSARMSIQTRAQAATQEAPIAEAKPQETGEAQDSYPENEDIHPENEKTEGESQEQAPPEQAHKGPQIKAEQAEPPQVHAPRDIQFQHFSAEVYNILEGNAQLRPFVRQNKEIRWVRISLREFAMLPLDYWRYMNNPFIILCSERYGHIILGNERQQAQLYIGIPAVYENHFEPRAQKLGFIQFKCCDDKEPAEGDYGYWILKL